MAVRMTAAQLYDYGTGPASQFDIVSKNGIEKNLKILASPPPAAGLQPGDRLVGGAPQGNMGESFDPGKWTTNTTMGGANAPGVQAPPPLEPGQIRPSGPGGTILSGPGGGAAGRDDVDPTTGNLLGEITYRLVRALA
jgi:hypothetical protein